MTKTYRLEQSQFIRKRREEIFPFFADASNLQRITPPFLHFHILSAPTNPIEAGTLIDYRLKLYGVPVYWRTRIETFEPPYSFMDIQLSGPYRLWHHRHEFIEVPGGTEMRDIVDYQLPFGPMGYIARSLFVRRSLKQIFDYRKAVIAEIFGE